MNVSGWNSVPDEAVFPSPAVHIRLAVPCVPYSFPCLFLGLLGVYFPD